MHFNHVLSTEMWTTTICNWWILGTWHR